MMNDNISEKTKLSVCIPVYQQKDLLVRCLDSLMQQTFTNFEVIITDDSSSDIIADYISSITTTFNIRYFKNTIPLGSPANWNESLKYASGKYIKMMHQDDWLAKEDALEKFVTVLDNNPDCDFAFAQCSDVVANKITPPRSNVKDSFDKWKSDKSVMLTYNLIGDPSTTIFRNHLGIWFDEKMKWCVDYDFYLMMYEKNSNIVLIDETLVFIGVHEGQVTNKVINDAGVVVYENIRLINKHQFTKLNLKQFDFFWRMIRKYQINSTDKINLIAKEEVVPEFLLKMVNVQKIIPKQLLNNGFISKALMWLTYITN
jgi:glycosyltransferase involved in cell wall biosynthesis